MSDHPKKMASILKNDSYLPNFCDAAVFLRVLLVIELFAIVFALISFRGGSLYCTGWRYRTGQLVDLY